MARTKCIRKTEHQIREEMRNLKMFMRTQREATKEDRFYALMRLHTLEWVMGYKRRTQQLRGK